MYVLHCICSYTDVQNKLVTIFKKHKTNLFLMLLKLKSDDVLNICIRIPAKNTLLLSITYLAEYRDILQLHFTYTVLNKHLFLLCECFH